MGKRAYSNEDQLQWREQTTGPGVLTFHLLYSWHWLSILCVCVCVSSPLANNAVQEVCQDKGQTAGLFLVSADNFMDNNLLIPASCFVLKKAVDLWKGITAPGAFEENAAMSLWLVSAVATC